MLLSLMLAAGLTSLLQAPTDEGGVTWAALPAQPGSHRYQRRATKAAASRRPLPRASTTLRAPALPWRSGNRQCCPTA